MNDPPTAPRWLTIDRFVEAFERARTLDARADLTAYAPPPDHPLYISVVCELVRVDLEYAWDERRLRAVEDYRPLFPRLFDDPAALAKVAFEHYRQRREHGQTPAPREYADRLGIDVSDWPGADDERGPATRVVSPSRLGEADHARDAAVFPEGGDRFADFLIREELGRGAFGRVYLADQGGLAGRPVVLKVSPNLMGEPRTLARLQHTHIVPVYSVHQSGALHAVCMPYLGRTTLADVLRTVRDLPALPTQGKDLLSTVGSVADPPGPQAPATPEPRSAELPLHKLQHLSYVEAVLWIGARLAEALAHAHARGVLHRDLKPANVLITDDGQPMLLDFNLADDVNERGSAAAARLGGTLPYMAPEQLELFRGDDRVIDGRADTYALGLVLFELLAGRPPFPTPTGPTHEVLTRLAEDRRRGTPRLRPLNPAVTPAVEAVVRRCLAPEPEDRYPSAEALREDLDRHLSHQPLKHTPEPSPRERAGKWVRRHPKLALVSAVTAAFVTVLAVVGGVAGTLGLALGEARDDLLRDAALRKFEAFGSGKREVEVLLNVRGPDLDLTAEAERRYPELLALFGDEGWRDSAEFRALDEDRRAALQNDVADLLRTRSEMLTRRAEESADEVRRSGLLEDSRRLLERADAIDPAGRPHSQPRTPREFYRKASDLAARGNFTEALPLAEEAVERDPRYFSAWFVLGTCQANLGDHVRAEGSFGHCVALWPEFVWGWFNRGLARLNQQAFGRAKRDFDRVLDLRPALAAALVNRALAKEGINDLRGAVDDLSAALAADDAPSRAYFLRARVHDKLGDAEAAKRDRDEGMKQVPSDETSWVVRGLARLSVSPTDALADFEEALKLNPRSRPALQNKAHVLAEYLGQTKEAVKVLDTLLRFHPDYVPGRGGRAVLHARLGQRDQAHADAVECLRRDPSPPTVYQAAGVYAMTSRTHSEDRAEALRLLASALGRGYGLEHIDRDHDLDPIRVTAEFRRIVAAARAVAPPNK